MGDLGRRTATVAILAVVLALGSVGPAAAQSVSGTQLQALAERAVDDPRALAQLRAVRQVDGRPVDVGQALGEAEGPALASRLRTLASGGSPSGAVAVGADEARRDAEDVLDGRRFQPSRVPRPLAGILTTIGRWLEPVIDPLGRLWERVVDSLAAQIVLVVVVFVVAAAISLRLVGRRSPRALERSRPFGVDTDGLDPDALEREATSAERDGDLDRAVRLRFVAGVLRLDRAGAIAYRSSMTTGQLKAGLCSAPFAELAAAFDEIAYGGRQAEASDVQAARATWPRVLAEARR
ncbi:MAG: DUF4129 domain-containing protein [Acidimicrobiales bacterium]